MVTNNSANYSPTQYNVQVGGANGTLTNIAPGGQVGYVLTSNGSSADPTFQAPASTGFLVYFLQNTASGVGGYYKLLVTPYTPHTELSFAGLASGDTVLRNWITEAGEPNLTSIPDGTFEFHVHAYKSAGTKDVQLYAEIWETNSAGVDIAKIGTTGTSTVLPGVEAQYILTFTTTSPYMLASSASRIDVRVYSTVSGAGTAPTAVISVGDADDTHISFPSQSVSVANFVPYTGAINNVNLGTYTLTAMCVGGGFLWTDVTGATQTLAIHNGYVTNRGGGVTYTLPATASLGDTMKIVGKAGLATVTPNANQQIVIGSSSGTVGITGTAVSSDAGDCLELICITAGASTVWRAASVVGVWTLN